MSTKPFVSLLMLTYNAPDYVAKAIESIRANTAEVDYELVVVDNASERETVEVLEALNAAGKIDRIQFNEENLLFAGGNNQAAEMASPDATHFVLINSDVEAVDPLWLRHLLDIHPAAGISSYGYVAHEPFRVDGYCMLINADLYRRYGGLDTEFAWWWGVTKLQAEILRDGHPVQGYYEHDDRLIHFGGKSGDGFKKATGMHVSFKEVASWFGGKRPKLLDPGNVPLKARLRGRVKRTLAALSS